MRKIKFRAWDPFAKEMLYHQSRWTEWAVRFDGQIGQAAEYGWRQHDKYILMQFTGLTDKDGQEIYAGDVCNVRRYVYDRSTRSEVKDKLHHICEVVWETPTNCHLRGYYNGKGKGDFYSIRFSEVWEIEKIGMVHENPELLEP